MLQSCENLEDAWASVANQAEISRLEAEEENAAFDHNDEPLTDDHDYLDQEPRDQIPAGLAIDHSDDGCITRVVRPLLKCMNKRQQQVFYTVRKSVSLKRGLRTTDCGLGIKRGLRYKTRTTAADWV